MPVESTDLYPGGRSTFRKVCATPWYGGRILSGGFAEALLLPTTCGGFEVPGASPIAVHDDNSP